VAETLGLPLSESEVLEHLLRSSLDGVLVFDRSFRIVLWNVVMEQLSGASARAVIGRDVFTTFPFLRAIGEDRHLEATLLGQSNVSRARPFFIPETGRSGTFDAHYSPLYAGTGEIVGGLTLVRDVTAERQADERRREVETRFQNMADAAPVLLWMSEVDGLCTFFNQTWLDFTGRTLTEEWGVGWAESVHHEDLQRCMDTYADAFNQREPFEIEYRLRRADGEFRWIWDRGIPRYSPGGDFAGFIGSCVDITEQKRAQDHLRGAIRARDDFLSVASHELRTPVTTLLLQLDSMARSIKRRPTEALASGRLAGNAGNALEQSRRLARLLDQLLDVSRIGAGKLLLELSEVDLVATVSEVIADLDGPLREAGCSVSMSAPEPVVGRWDRFRLRQVVGNLITNALKYAAGLPIEVELAKGRGQATVRVSDHGVGIARGDHARIFGRFERVASGRHFPGLGLGLWLTREIVVAHGGDAQVESEPGAGATFIVTLPL
jgi:PAS domain S-box-containing protein